MPFWLFLRCAPKLTVWSVNPVNIARIFIGSWLAFCASKRFRSFIEDCQIRLIHKRPAAFSSSGLTHDARVLHVLKSFRYRRGRYPNLLRSGGNGGNGVPLRVLKNSQHRCYLPHGRNIVGKVLNISARHTGVSSLSSMSRSDKDDCVSSICEERTASFRTYV